jgi:PAS domain S-box-containing protein
MMARLDRAGASEILDLVHDAIIVRDHGGRILQWNLAAEQQYGWRRDEAIGQRMDGLLQCSSARSADVIQVELLDQGLWEGEVSRRSRHGDVLWVEARWSLRRDDKGRPLHVVETSRDITARRQSEAATRLTEYRFRNLFQAMAVAFWEIDFSAVGEMLRALLASGVTDIRGHMLADRGFVREAMRRSRVLDVNAKTLSLFGAASGDDIVGGSVERFWPVESESVFVEAVVASIEKRPTYITETQLLSLSGERIDVLFTVSWSPESRKQGVILLGVVDIGESKRAQARVERSEVKYRNLFQYIPISLWQLSARGILPVLGALRAQGVDDLAAYFEQRPQFLDEAMELITVEEVNDTTIRMFGGESAQDFLGPITRYWDTSPDTLRRSLIARFRGKSSHAEETKVRTLDGRLIDIYFTSAFPPALAELGITIVGAVDIGARVEAQDALHRLQADFARAARISMLGEFTASIAHEVNQPLAAIATNAEAGLRWLSRPEPDIEEAREASTRIVADARRAAAIIARVRGMAEQRAPERSALNLNSLVDETILFLRHDLKAGGVDVRLCLAEELPLVNGDRTQIQQVLVNLSVNALQAMADRPESMRTLSIGTAVDSHGRALITVEDSGVGLPKGAEGRLFDSFYTTKESGMGMGLRICRSIVEAHGGQIAASARKEGEGALFSVALPAAPPEAHTKV